MPTRSLHVALVDLDEGAAGCNDKDQAGSYGTATHAGGAVGRVYRRLKRAHARLPVLSFAHAAAVLRRAGHTVTVHRDAPDRADVVVIATSIVGHAAELELARRVRAALPGARIGFSGAFARAVPAPFLEVGDFVIDGETDAWAGAGRDLGESAGVVDAGVVADLDALPFPDWAGFPLDAYGYRPLLARGRFATTQASRGCQFACPYCPYLPIQGTRYRVRSADGVADELAYVTERFGVCSVLFRDINFSTDREHTAQIAEAILGRGIDVDWSCETRADCLDPELIRLMQRAGLRSINLGVESPDDALLEANGRRPYDHEHLERIVRFSEQNGVRIAAFFMIGFPGDTEDSVERTIEYARALNPSFAQFTVVTPYPGTPYYEQMRREGRLLDADWSAFTSYEPVMRLDHLEPDDVRRLRDRAYRRFYLRPRWLLHRGAKLAPRSLPGLRTYPPTGGN